MGEFFPLKEERTIDTDPIQTQTQPQMNPKSHWGRFFGLLAEVAQRAFEAVKTEVPEAGLEPARP